jgi:hypothetical protein
MKVNAHSLAAACLAGVFAATAATPADARHLRRHHHVSTVAQIPSPGAAIREPDPYGVYFGGTKVSRDPDPHVRQELLLDYWAIYRW